MNNFQITKEGKNMMDANEIGRKLRELRGETPPPVVACACDISVSALCMYETGKRIPRDEIKLKLARYYNTSIDALFYAT